MVESVGDDVTEFSPGDRVSVDSTLTCGEGRFCAAGHANLCQNWNASGVARTNGSTADFQAARSRTCTASATASTWNSPR